MLSATNITEPGWESNASVQQQPSANTDIFEYSGSPIPSFSESSVRPYHGNFDVAAIFHAGRQAFSVPQSVASSHNRPVFNGSAMDNTDARWYDESQQVVEIPSTLPLTNAASRIGNSGTIPQQFPPSSTSRQLVRFDSNQAVNHYIEQCGNEGMP